MAFLARLNDVAPGAESATFLQDLALDFTFDLFRVSKVGKSVSGLQFPSAERDEWERYFSARKADAKRLSARIADAEAEINDRVYCLFRS